MVKRVKVKWDEGERPKRAPVEWEIPPNDREDAAQAKSLQPKWDRPGLHESLHESMPHIKSTSTNVLLEGGTPDIGTSYAIVTDLFTGDQAGDNKWPWPPLRQQKGWESHQIAKAGDMAVFVGCTRADVLMKGKRVRAEVGGYLINGGVWTIVEPSSLGKKLA